MVKKTGTKLISLLLLATVSATSQAQLPWSDDTHQIAFGDFNGDGKTDLLYVARSSSGSSGIALSNNAGPYNVSQTWSSNHLGISWHSGTYKPFVADFNGDGKADILFQRQTPGDHYLLFANSSGQIAAIGQTIPSNQGGQIWSADAHRIVTGDFNGDGKADVFLQAALSNGLNAVFLAGASGTFGGAQQTWGNGHIGFKWSLQNAVVHAGDFNGDGKADLFVQAKPEMVLIDYEVAFVIPAYPPGRFGIANAKAANGNGEIFYTPALQIWDRKYQNVDWSAANYNAVIGDFNGDGRADIVLQGKRAGLVNAQFNVSAAGQIVSANVLTDPSILVATADQYRIYAGNFDGTAGAGVYLQALTTGGSSSISWNSTTTASCTEVFKYDVLGRLRTITNCNGSTSSYNFDPAGNRTTISTTAP